MRGLQQTNHDILERKLWCSSSAVSPGLSCHGGLGGKQALVPAGNNPLGDTGVRGAGK